jgi:hypothetical protein
VRFACICVSLLLGSQVRQNCPPADPSKVNCALRKGTRTSLVNLLVSRAPCSLPPPAYLAAPWTGPILVACCRLVRGCFDAGCWVLHPVAVTTSCPDRFSSFCLTVDHFGRVVRCEGWPQLRRWSIVVVFENRRSMADQHNHVYMLKEA